MPTKCKTGCGKNAILKRPKTGDALCRPCFFWAFETEVHNTISSGRLFQPGQHVAVCASGGKDSTVLAHVLNTLNQRYDYGLRLTLLSIDEGITGYRDDSLATVRRNRDQYGLPLTILSYRDLYGWSMDDIVRETGRRNNCTFCGVLRRQAFERGAALLGAHVLATGHNADDVAETVLMNVLRGDVARLRRCTALTTGSDGSIPRCKPFKYTYEKEIVMYAYFKRLDYFSTECTYSPNAYRGYARAFLKDLEAVRPTCIMDILHSGERLAAGEAAVARLAARGTCQRCGHVSSQPVCQACTLLHGLNQGTPRLGVGKSSKVGRPGTVAGSKSAEMEASHDTLSADTAAAGGVGSGADSDVGSPHELGGGSEAGTGCGTKLCCRNKANCGKEMTNGEQDVTGGTNNSQMACNGIR